MRTIGQHGDGNGEFNYPTELLMKNGVLAVVDAMNFRVQMLNRNGAFQGTIGKIGDSSGQFFRPKGIGVDSEDHIYVVEGAWGMVQVFDREGRLLYTFGKRGTQLGEFQLPAGMFIDSNDRVYVVDSVNRRVQVFQYHGLKTGHRRSTFWACTTWVPEHPRLAARVRMRASTVTRPTPALARGRYGAKHFPRRPTLFIAATLPRTGECSRR